MNRRCIMTSRKGNFSELRQAEVRGIYLLRTWVNERVRSAHLSGGRARGMRLRARFAYEERDDRSPSARDARSNYGRHER
jgi:hypothetical protein